MLTIGRKLIQGEKKFSRRGISIEKDSQNPNDCKIKGVAER